MSPKGPGKRVDPDGFDWLVAAMERIDCAATLGIAEILPMGGLAAGAGRARVVDERLEQYGTVGVTGLPII